MRVGDLDDPNRPDLDPVEAPEAFYDALVPFARSVEVWRTGYFHALGGGGEDGGRTGAREVVEWVKGTGLMPYLERIGGGEDEVAKAAFLKRYEEEVGEWYKERADGKVLLGYPRLFVVAVRK